MCKRKGECKPPRPKQSGRFGFGWKKTRCIWPSHFKRTSILERCEVLRALATPLQPAEDLPAVRSITRRILYPPMSISSVHQPPFNGRSILQVRPPIHFSNFSIPSTKRLPKTKQHNARNRFKALHRTAWSTHEIRLRDRLSYQSVDRSCAHGRNVSSTSSPRPAAAMKNVGPSQDVTLQHTMEASSMEILKALPPTDCPPRDREVSSLRSRFNHPPIESSIRGICFAHRAKIE